MPLNEIGSCRAFPAHFPHSDQQIGNNSSPGARRSDTGDATDAADAYSAKSRSFVVHHGETLRKRVGAPDLLRPPPFNRSLSPAIKHFHVGV